MAIVLLGPLNKEGLQLAQVIQEDIPCVGPLQHCQHIRGVETWAAHCVCVRMHVCVCVLWAQTQGGTLTHVHKLCYNTSLGRPCNK